MPRLVKSGDLARAIVTLVDYDEPYDLRIPDRKARTRTTLGQLGKVAEEGTEVIQAVKYHEGDRKVVHEAIDLILSGATLLRIAANELKLDRACLDKLIKIAADEVDVKLLQRWFPEIIEERRASK